MTTEQQKILDLADSGDEKNKNLALSLAKNYGWDFWTKTYLLANLISIKSDEIVIKNCNNNESFTISCGQIKILRKTLERAKKYSISSDTKFFKLITEIHLIPKDYRKTFQINQIDSFGNNVLEVCIKQ
ncbi:hypothetical protein AD998_01840 [bacterium 336/3]|nr:hypothetical protein AD998_01840 [bacterium 336/3]